jgi:hypothetical protein
MPGNPLIPEVPAKPPYSRYRLMIIVLYMLCLGTTVKSHFLVECGGRKSCIVIYLLCQAYMHGEVNLSNFVHACQLCIIVPEMFTF